LLTLSETSQSIYDSLVALEEQLEKEEGLSDALRSTLAENRLERLAAEGRNKNE
jgi:hypothetical protein